MNFGRIFAIHNWTAFFTVICLGLIQVTITYCGSHLAIVALPIHINDRKRRAYRIVFGALLTIFVFLTFLLAKLNDTNQRRSDLLVQQERTKQEALQEQLHQTLDAVLDSQIQLAALRQAVSAHPPGAERTAMVESINHVEETLQNQENAMRRASRQK